MRTRIASGLGLPEFALDPDRDSIGFASCAIGEHLKADPDPSHEDEQ